MHEGTETGQPWRVGVKAWVEGRGETLLGRGRGQLLRAVDEHGSISAAAREIGLSYATAWHRLDAMSRAAGRPLVEARAGGRRGGGTTLTRAGRTVLEAWTLLRRRQGQFREETGREIDALLRELPDRP